MVCCFFVLLGGLPGEILDLEFSHLSEAHGVPGQGMVVGHTPVSSSVLLALCMGGTS